MIENGSTLDGAAVTAATPNNAVCKAIVMIATKVPNCLKRARMCFPARQGLS
jgi:hypothetical protein